MTLIAAIGRDKHVGVRRAHRAHLLRAASPSALRYTAADDRLQRWWQRQEYRDAFRAFTIRIQTQAEYAVAEEMARRQMEAERGG